MAENKIIKIYSGPEVAVVLLKEILEDHGIGCSIKNIFQSGLTAGFYGGSPSTIDLYIQKIEHLTVTSASAKICRPCR